jgi:hypothetical protein
MQGIPLLNEKLLASQEGLCYMELVSQLNNYDYFAVFTVC